METYLVTFIPKLKDQQIIEVELDHLSEIDSTFSYSKRRNLFIFEDTDKARIFRRSMWIKEKLKKRGIDADFSMLKFKEQRGGMRKFTLFGSIGNTRDSLKL